MINGDRVRQVRELRGLTQKDLATSIDITQPFIAQIETGFAQPSEEVLAALSQHTGFPTAFFRQEPPVDFPLGSLLFRARAGTTAGERWKAYRYAQLLFELYQKLGSRLSNVEVNVPRLVGTPAEPLYPADAARMTRAALALSPDTPLDSLIRELERKGVIILGLPIALIGIDAFAVWAGADKSRPVIVLSADAPGDRQRFSVAHELGHLVMHHAPEGTVSSVEREADQFAAEFLLPEIAMRTEIIPPVTLTDLAQLKVRWKVSIQTLIRRAYDLNIVTERQYRALFEKLSAYGWRTREPANLDVPAEKPRALREMAEVLYHNPIDFERLAQRILVSPEDMKEMLYAFAGDAKPQDQGHDTDPVSHKVVPFTRRRPGR